MARSRSNSDSRGAAAAEPTALRHQRTRLDHAREISEDYVELIDQLIRESGEARAVDLARHLGVTHVTVSKTIDRLRTEGLVESAPYRAIFLTDKGRKLAQKCRRRHELVVEFLLALGVGQSDAEIDAEGIEHHLSRKTLLAMQGFVEKSRG